MSFLALANSDPWYQWTYAAIESNWSFDNQGLVVLDNGDVWAWVSNPPEPYNLGEQNEAAWVGKVHPDGNVRVFGDSWAHGAENDSIEGIQLTDTFAPHTKFGPTFTSPTDLVSDGSLIWLFQSRSGHLFEFNPDTYALEWVAFDGTLAPANGPYTDHGDAKQANYAVGVIGPFFWKGDLYFWDNVYRLSGAVDNPARIKTLRRFDPVAGTMGTVTTALSSPVGMPTGDDLAWFGTTNPATGFPNYVNNDVFFDQIGGGAGTLIAQGIHNDWLYVLGRNVSTIGLAAQWIRRLDLNNPNNGFQFLYYGLLYEDQLDRIPRDPLSDFASSPTGVPHPDQNPTWYSDWKPGKGIPDLLGFAPGTQAAVVGDDLVFINETTRQIVWAYNIFGDTLCAINIPELLNAVEIQGGPVRHDRENPMFRVIANGTTGAHSVTSHNYRNRPHWWHNIDGAAPAHANIQTPSLYSNPNSEQWAGKLLYINNVADNNMTWVDFEAIHAHLIKVLEPKIGAAGEYRLDLSFEGRYLRGYGPAVDIKPPSAPEEITLQ
jgi:hypothetical protein